MDVKAQIKKEDIEIQPFQIGLFIFCTMLYNCIMCICFCFIAWSKDWWAALLLIPICALTPSYKTKSHKDEDTEDKDNE